MHDREAELLRAIEQRRAALVSRADAFQTTVATSLDPRNKFRQHPLAGLALSLLAGITVALASPRRPARKAMAGVMGIIGAVLPGLLKTVAPGLLLGLVSPLLSQIGRKGTSEPASTRPAPDLRPEP